MLNFILMKIVKHFLLKLLTMDNHCGSINNVKKKERGTKNE